MAKTNEQNDEPRGVAYYLDQINNISGNRKCVYRGQANAEWRLESGAARQIRQSIDPNDQGLNELPENALIFSQLDLIKISRNMGFGVQDGRELKDLELLTELQHFGAATCLLDFTENTLVALYMACKGLDTVDGKVYVLPDANLEIVTVNTEIKHAINRSSPVKFIPHMHGSAERRIIRQSGVFIIGLDGQHDALKIVTIFSQHKADILTELEKKYHISDETLFIDLSGFASSRSVRKPLKTYDTGFYKGLNYHEAGLSADKAEAEYLFNEAIKSYTEAIELKPDFPEAYYNCGCVKATLDQHEAAIADYDEALRLTPDDANAYYNRGNSKAALGQYEAALADYEEALRLTPDDATAYVNRGNSKYALDRHEAAIADYDEAISLKPDGADAYVNRGVVKRELDDVNGARNDLLKAKALFESQNRPGDVVKVDKLLRDLDNPNSPESDA